MVVNGIVCAVGYFYIRVFEYVGDVRSLSVYVSKCSPLVGRFFWNLFSVVCGSEVFVDGLGRGYCKGYCV